MKSTEKRSTDRFWLCLKCAFIYVSTAKAETCPCNGGQMKRISKQKYVAMCRERSGIEIKISSPIITRHNG